MGNQVLGPLPEDQRATARLAKRAEYYGQVMGGATTELINTSIFMLKTADTMTPGSFGRAREVENVTKLMAEGRQMLNTALEYMKYASTHDIEPEQMEIINQYKGPKKRPRRNKGEAITIDAEAEANRVFG